MNCGKYNKKITFCRYKEVAGGRKTEQELEKIRTVYASVKATGGTENYELDRLNNTVAYDVRTRFDPALMNTALVILWNGRRFEIKSAIDVREQQRELALTCREILKAGDSHVRHASFEY